MSNQEMNQQKQKAWKVLEQGQHIKFYSAKNTEGKACAPDADEAVAWCINGALVKVYGWGEEFSSAIDKLRQTLGTSPVAWNNSPERTKEEVVAILKKLDL